MRHVPLALALAAAVSLCSSAFAADPQYRKIKDIPIGGGAQFDHLTADPDHQRLYVTHGSKIVVIDTREDTVIGEIPNTPGVHDFALANDLQRGFSSNGQASTSSIIDLAAKDDAGKPTFKEIMTVKTGGNPDAIIYLQKAGEVWTCNARSQTFTAFDAKTGKVVSDGVALGGQPSAAQADPDLNRVFISLEDKSQVVEVDQKERTVLNRWPLAPATGPTAMALIPDQHRLLIAASKMVLMDYTNGEVLSTLDCGQGVDAVVYDPVTKLAFVSAGDSGSVTVAKVADDKLIFVQNLTTERRARTMALDPKIHRLYIASPGTNGLKVIVYGIDEATP